MSDSPSEERKVYKLGARYQDSNRKSDGKKTVKAKVEIHEVKGKDLHEMLENVIEEIEGHINKHKSSDQRSFEKYLDTFQSRKKDLFNAAYFYNESENVREFIGRIMMLCEHGLHRAKAAKGDEEEEKSAVDTTRAILTQMLIDEFGEDRLRDVKTH